MLEVRVRFAPSPTGALHIGGVRTALYNYLLARKHGGKMILRIEDTDQGRFVAGAEEYIRESLAWAGIKIDEGVAEGGPHAPYRQSERKEIYKKYCEQLIGSGHAYYAFDSEAEINAMREKLKASADQNQHYNSHSRVEMKNSLTLGEVDVKNRLKSGDPYVIRMKVEPNQEILLNDLIRGPVTFNSSLMDDKVLMKSDGMPTYHLAHMVDDYLMKISHVIRGEEWLPSAPHHVLLYRYLGWENAMPSFAHLPLLLKPDGNGKLSKRDADKMGFPIFPLNWKDPQTGEMATGYREAGYLPEALINFLVLLGWNPGTEQEIFSLDQLIETFTLERIGKAGARFDIQKAQWFNQQYLRNKTDEELSHYLLKSLKKENINGEPGKVLKVVHAMKERITFPSDFWDQGKFFFIAPATFDDQIVSKKWNREAVSFFTAFKEEIRLLTSFSAENAKSSLEKVAAGLGIKTGQVLQVLRMVLTGGASGPDLMVTLEILGALETQKRIEYALESIPLKTV